MPTATVTTKGQITIPLTVRQRLRLKAGDRVDFILNPGGDVTLRPKRVPFEQVAGILASRKQQPASVRRMDAGVENEMRRRWAGKKRVAPA
jgi:AbrB family looped-hinge helix DNA binding protein